MLKLRWFSMCDENGVQTEPVLQYWDDILKYWKDVGMYQCKTWEKEEALEDETAVYE